MQNIIYRTSISQRTTVCLIFLLSSVQLFCQAPTSDHYSVNEGLLSPTVYDLRLDASGYLWIATDKGVNRFDGLKMESFTKEDGLADRDILLMEEDGEGRLWFLSYTGKLSFWQHGKMHNEHNSTLLKDHEPLSTIWDFWEGGEGNFWFGSRSQGLIAFPAREEHRQLREFNDLAAPTDIPVYCVFGGGIDSVFFVKPSGVFLFADGVPRPYMAFDSNVAFNRIVYHEPSGLLFCAGRNVISCFNIKKKQCMWSRQLQFAHVINKLKILADGELWVATDQGAAHFTFNSTLIDRYHLDKKVSDILIDREGGIWFSTLFDGLYYSRNRAVLNYSTKPKYAILKSADTLLFGGAEMELHRIVRNELLQTQFDYEIVDYAGFEIGHQSSQHNILSLSKGPKGRMWVLSSKGLFCLADSKMMGCLPGKYRDVCYHAQRVFIASSRQFMAVDEDEFERVISLCKAGDLSQEVYEEMVLGNSVRQQRAFQFEPLSPHELLVATEMGVFVYQDSTAMLVEQKVFDSLKDDAIISMKKTPSGDLWLLSARSGVYKLSDGSTKLIKIDSTTRGAEYNAMDIDSDSELWVATNKGLIHYREVGGTYTANQYNKFHGLAGDFINDVKVVGDTVWLATSEGISCVAKNRLQSTVGPLLHLLLGSAGVRLNNAVPQLQVTSGTELMIPYQVISFKEQNEHVLHYIVDGDTFKTDYGASSKLALPSLTTGKHSIVIVALDSEGNLSNEETLMVSVSSIWWTNRWWTALALVALLLLVGGVLNRYNLSRKMDPSALPEESKHSGYIMVKSSTNGGEIKVELKDLIFIKAAGDYIELFLHNQKILVRKTMKQMMAELMHEGQFMRVHKSYIVNIDQMDSYRGDELEALGVSIPISRTKRNTVKEYLATMTRSAANTSV